MEFLTIKFSKYAVITLDVSLVGFSCHSAFCATKIGSGDSGETKVDPHWVQDPPWSFNGPCHGPTVHLTWSFIYGLYFCILCNKNLVKVLWRHKDRPPLGLVPAMVLQWTLPWPGNKPNMALYILAVFVHSMQ